MADTAARTGGRILLVETLHPGPAAWAAIREADRVYRTTDAVPPDPRSLADLAVAGYTVVCFCPRGSRPAATDLRDELERLPDPPRVELIGGSADPAGTRVLDLVAVVDRLRRDCPWDREQTHESLARHLLEETYEALEAVEAGDPAHLREELGDLLALVLFYARIAQEHGTGPWTVDDLAGAAADKLVRRHPHVYAGRELGDAAAVEGAWEQIKSAEGRRASVVDGIPLSLPALTLAGKLVDRAAKTRLPVPVPDGGGTGEALFALVVEAHRRGLDPEQELRRTARRYADAMVEAERQDS